MPAAGRPQGGRPSTSRGGTQSTYVLCRDAAGCEVYARGDSNYSQRLRDGDDLLMTASGATHAQPLARVRGDATVLVASNASVPAGMASTTYNTVCSRGTVPGVTLCQPVAPGQPTRAYTLPHYGDQGLLPPGSDNPNAAGMDHGGVVPVPTTMPQGEFPGIPPCNLYTFNSKAVLGPSICGTQDGSRNILLNPPQ